MPRLTLIILLLSLPLMAQKTVSVPAGVSNRSVVRIMNTSFGPLNETATERAIVHRGFLPLIVNSYEADADGDGVADAYDECPGTAQGVLVDNKGCKVFALDADTFVVETLSNSCIGQSDGVVSVKALNTNYNYIVEFSGSSAVIDLNNTNNFSGRFEGLSTGSYSLCITLVEQPEYRQCYQVMVEEPEALSVEAYSDLSNNTVELQLAGDGPYTISLNDDEIRTNERKLVLPLKPGKNILSVRAKAECQGSYFEEIFVSEQVILYPNPTVGPVQIYVSGSDTSTLLTVRNLQGQVLFNRELSVPNSRVIEYSFGRYPQGVYLIELSGTSIKKQLKVVKK